MVITNNIITNNINKYYKGGMVTSSHPIVGFTPRDTLKLGNVVLIVTVVTIVPPMLLIVTMSLLLPLLLH